MALVLIAWLIDAAFETYSAALLNHMGGLVSRCVQIRSTIERDGIAKCVCACAELVRRGSCSAALVRFNTGYIMVAKARLDPIEVRQWRTSAGHATAGGIGGLARYVGGGIAGLPLDGLPIDRHGGLLSTPPLGRIRCRGWTEDVEDREARCEATPGGGFVSTGSDLGGLHIARSSRIGAIQPGLNRSEHSWSLLDERSLPRHGLSPSIAMRRALVGRGTSWSAPSAAPAATHAANLVHRGARTAIARGTEALLVIAAVLRRCSMANPGQLEGSIADERRRCLSLVVGELTGLTPSDLLVDAWPAAHGRPSSVNPLRE